MTFDHEVSLKQDFTDKQDLLQRAVDKIKKVGSQTSLYDANGSFLMKNSETRRAEESLF